MERTTWECGWWSPTLCVHNAYMMFFFFFFEECCTEEHLERVTKRGISFQPGKNEKKKSKRRVGKRKREIKKKITKYKKNNSAYMKLNLDQNCLYPFNIKRCHKIGGKEIWEIKKLPGKRGGSEGNKRKRMFVFSWVQCSSCDTLYFAHNAHIQPNPHSQKRNMKTSLLQKLTSVFFLFFWFFNNGPVNHTTLLWKVHESTRIQREREKGKKGVRTTKRTKHSARSLKTKFF